MPLIRVHNIVPSLILCIYCRKVSVDSVCNRHVVFRAGVEVTEDCRLRTMDAGSDDVEVGLVSSH